MGGLSLLVAVAAAWGWGAATQPFPERESTPPCVPTSVDAGEAVFPDQVVVSVFNGSKRSGLAGLTMDKLGGRGFVSAGTGNAPEPTAKTQVQGEADNPAVALVAAQFRNAEIVPSQNLGLGVVVVVSQGFKDLKPRAPESLTAEAPATICAAPGTE